MPELLPAAFPELPECPAAEMLLLVAATAKSAAVVLLQSNSHAKARNNC